MKLAAGYPVAGGEAALDLCEAVAAHRERVEEVYFAAPGQASGRAPAREDGEVWDNLAALRRLGVRLDLLFNANCYGTDAASPGLADRICRTLDVVGGRCGVDVVTTASPFIAGAVRARYPGIELRASVNMRIGTVGAMEMLAGLFDGFYAQRDHNRDPGRLAELREWTRAHGKKLCLLANSGCLAFCPGQTFHDNLVAHEPGLRGGPALQAEALTCRRFLADPENWPAILAATWIRPEDLGRYEGLADLAKLATRMHRSPRLVVAAYARGRHRGNLLDLLEPGHGDLLGDAWIDAGALPGDWFERTAGCDRRCGRCGYCRGALERALVSGSGPERRQDRAFLTPSHRDS
jgi:collagenase-like PrtC family protease